MYENKINLFNMYDFADLWICKIKYIQSSPK